jgi:polygalacturonase
MRRYPSRRDVLKAGGAAAAGGLVVPALLGAASPARTPLWTPAAADPWVAVPGILARITPPTFPDRDVRVTDHGARGDGRADNTRAFRDAIVACNKAGGGRVVVPKGTFLTGAIHLLSNVNLHLVAGARILFSTDHRKYLPMVWTRWQGIECFNYSPFVYARNQTNLAITGAGTLDGQASKGPWFDWDRKRDPDWQVLQKMAVDDVPVPDRRFGNGHFLKPNMIQFYGCANILIEGVSIRNPAMWTVHPVLSRNVTIRDISIYSRGGMVDGCDPEATADVHIHHCTFDTGDDAVVVKAGRDIDGRRVGVPSANIVVENCTMLGRWGAVTVGSEMSGGVRNVFFQDCTVRPGPSYRTFYVLYLKTNKRRGGTVDGIHARRINGRSIDRGSFYVDMNYSLTGPGHGPIVFPTVRNITVDGMTIDGAPYAVNLNGAAESRIQNVRISNSTFRDMVGPNVIRNADNVTFHNVTINGEPA